MLRAKAAAVRELRREYRNWPQVAINRALSRNPKRYSVRGGPVLRGPSDNDLEVIILEVFRRGDYADERIQPGANDVVFDVGANVGAFSLFIAPKCAHVYAYEAWPENVPYLRRNVSILDNVTVVAAAMSSSDAPTRMYRSPTAGGHLMFDRGFGDFVEVPSVTLADEIDRVGGRIGLLKLDCEGAEGVILDALPDAYWDRIQRVVMEYHDNVSPVDHKELRARFEASGMHTDTFHESGPFGYLVGWR